MRLDAVVASAGLCGVGTPEGTYTRYEKCPFCDGENCFCVYPDHAHCFHEQRRFTYQEIVSYLHKAAPCSVTSFYSSATEKMPEQLRWSENEFRTTNFFFPVYGWTRENEPYVLCYDKNDQLIDIVFAAPNKDWITLLDTQKILNQSCQWLFIFQNIHHVVHIRRMWEKMWPTNKILLTCLPPVPDAQLICSLPDLRGKSVTIFGLNEPVEQVFINKLYAAGAKQVMAPPEKILRPSLWTDEYLQKMVQHENFKTLKQDKRFSTSPIKRSAVVKERRFNMLAEFEEVYCPRKMKFMGQSYLLLNPNEFDIPSVDFNSDILQWMLQKHLVQHGIDTTQKIVDDTKSILIGRAKTVEPVARNIGNRWMRTQEAVYVNATPNIIYEITADSIVSKEQNSVKGVYFPEKEYGNFTVKETDKSVRKLMVQICGKHGDNLINPLFGAYMAVLPFLANTFHPIVLLDAPEGYGKTFTAILVRDIIDPQQRVANIPAMTNKIMDIAHILADKTVAIVDNATELKHTTATLLNEAVTSTQITYRKMLTNLNSCVANTNGMIIITGVRPEINQSDLLSRMLIASLDKPKHKKDYDDIKYLIPEIRFALMRVMQEILKNYNEILSGERQTRFCVFDALFRYALAKCGWGDIEYSHIMKTQRTQSTDILAGHNRLMDFLLHDVQKGKTYSSRELYNLAVEKIHTDMTHIGFMRKVVSLEPALNRANVKLIKTRSNKTNNYVLEDIDE